MWGYEQVGPTSQMRAGNWFEVEIWCFGGVSLRRVWTPKMWTCNTLKFLDFRKLLGRIIKRF
jgi:hypothetical protein